MSPAVPFTTRPELVGRFGMVSSTHWLASQSGMAVLEAGGNAFDAAVTTGLVLQVVEPHLNGPGGDVPIIAWDAAAGKPLVVCGQGVAPAAATIDKFESLELDLVPGNGLLPAVVPGAFGAWMLLLREHGTLSLREVMRYAIEYADDGFVVLPAMTEAVESVSSVFTDHWPSSGEVWLRGGRAPQAGSMFANPHLAATYRRIMLEAEAFSSDRCEQIEAARACFYGGFVAEAISALYATETVDVSGRAHRGLLDYDDLEQWRATLEEPVSLQYRDHTVLKPGAWTQGPVFLQQLALLEGFDLESLGSSSPELIHLVAECAKLAFADREAYYGDPNHVEVPLDDLLSHEYNLQRRALVRDEAATDGLNPGVLHGRRPRLPRTRVINPDEHLVLGEPMARSAGRLQGDTCHLDVADRFGNLVAATPSGGWLQDSPTVPGLGFSISTRGQMFWLDRDVPNCLAPRKRPRTTLSPSLVLRAGEPYLAFGTPGGDMQDQWTLPFFLRHVHHGMNLQEAIDAPTWHTSHVPSSFWPRLVEPEGLFVEDRVGTRTLQGLRKRGHRIGVEGGWSLGRTTAVSRENNGVLRSAASPRGMHSYSVGR